MSQESALEFEDDLELIRSAAVSAGIIATGFFRQDVKTWTKENASPVSEADLAVDRYLKATLCAERPDYGWLSEETADDLDRMNKDRIFVVDPIDGTRGYLQGDDSWTVCITVVEKGKPVAGVVYAPIRDELYEAIANGGAYLNGEPIRRRARLGNAGPIMPAPGAVHRELEARGISFVRGPAIRSLALRLVQVATGVLDIAVSRRGAQDWDIASASLILQECGISLEDVCCGPPTFNKEEIRHGAIAAMLEDSLKDDIHEVLRNIYGCPIDN
ncbi:3'(2'),5'-bisphosphate nucleotidase CysQ [Maritalea porphyrae]|jgi:myo-inositol-1(or 4)-monophosphatase|uniref:3'(2'),5'-bisphosphate nucleotidase CysQ n=1 Tax=Maritalea porphyrae TaxID=880732 RepID=UPI0022AE720F|nr:3'(2'),5'-bisphosphate nucleotidase CysQ [Maritalea porphyrae]MCZ4271416.1 3'(2'),5'-bisphosphate nucleotidase CysQ [Maritalea porphyrae]